MRPVDRSLASGVDAGARRRQMLTVAGAGPSLKSLLKQQSRRLETQTSDMREAANGVLRKLSLGTF